MADSQNSGERPGQLSGAKDFPESISVDNASTDQEVHGASAEQLSADQSAEFEPFRSYLQVLAETQLHRRLKCKVDPADVVQQTLLQAYQAKDQFRGSTKAEKAGWLRTILGNVLCGLARDFSRQCRDVQRERSIQAVEKSSLKLADLLSADSSSPSAALHRDERANALAQAMLKLTTEQRQAIILKYWHDATLAEIGEELNKSTEAVAGLIFRGMQKLKSEFSNQPEHIP